MNESKVLKQIQEKDRAMKVNLTCGKFPSVKSLEILWNIHLAVKKVDIPNKASWRIYEHGLICLDVFSPHVAQEKVLLQEIWMSVDFLLNISNKITNWSKGLETLLSFQFPGFLQCPEDLSEAKFHVFNDAFEKVYASVIYQKSVCK